MMLAIVDYGSGNLRSVTKAFERVTAETSVQVLVTRMPDGIRQASHIVLPGVGAFADCMRGLAGIPGMIDALTEEVLRKKKKFLGICVGMQMLFEKGYEHGEHKGLGWLKGEVVTLRTPHSTLKIPHMGWNDLAIKNPHPIMKGIENGAHAYFVHSYHAQATASDLIATTDYGQSVAAVVARDHIMGTQFHPEKSQETGLMLLKNFLAL